MTEEISKHVFKKVLFIFLNSLHICFYPDLTPGSLLWYTMMYQSKRLYTNFKFHVAWHHRSLSKRH